MQVSVLDAVDGRILTKYWQQAGCQDSIRTALMQYDAGQGNVPRWPRLTCIYIPTVFPNLRNASALVTLGLLLSFLQRGMRYNFCLYSEPWIQRTLLYPSKWFVVKDKISLEFARVVPIVKVHCIQGFE